MHRSALSLAAALTVAASLCASAGAATPIKFGQPLSLETGFQVGNPGLVVTGDFNGDGHTDVLATAPSLDHAGTLRVFDGDGGGHFTAQPSAMTGAPADKHAVGDVNGDGRDDVLVISDPRHMQVLLGQADGSLAPGQLFDFGTFDQPVLADANGDHIADVVDVLPKGVTTYLSDGHGAFAAAIHQTVKRKVSATTTLFQDPYGPAAVADFNGDGKVDVAVSDREGVRHKHGKPTSHAVIEILPGTGTGHFGKPVLSLLGTGQTVLFAPQAGDFNGDGRTDVAAGSRADQDQTESVLVALGKGKGRFGKARCYSLGACKQFHNESGEFGYVDVTVGDFNHDSRQDLAAAEFDLIGPAILKGTGSGTFTSQAPLKLAIRSHYADTTADINGDHVDDLVLFNGRQVVILPGT